MKHFRSVAYGTHHWSFVVGGWSVVCLLLALPIALLPLPSAILLIGLGLMVVLACIDPVWALYAAVLSVPVQELVHLPGGVSYTQAALLLAAVAWGLRILAYPERPVVFGRPALGLAILLWVLALAATTTPYSLVEGLKETLRWFTVTLIYLLALNSAVVLRHAPRDWQWRVAGLVGCLLIAPAASALIGLWQFVTATGPPSFAIADGRFVRAYGTIGQPNSFAGYLNMAWPLAVALALGAWQAVLTQGQHQRATLALAALFFSGVAGVLLAALGASFSRGSWVGAAGGAAILVIAATASLDRAVRQRLVRWIAGVGAVGGLVLVLGGTNLVPDPIAQRVGSITRNLRLFDVRTVEVTPENFAVVERMSHLQAGWRMVSTYPLTGVGPGNFTLAYEGQGTQQTQPFALHPWYVSQGHAHNYYLHIAAEAGIAGFLGYLVLVGLLARQAYATLCATRGWFWRSIAIGGCGVLAAVAAHNLFENLHVLNMGVQLGALWGVLVALEKNCQTATTT